MSAPGCLSGTNTHFNWGENTFNLEVLEVGNDGHCCRVQILPLQPDETITRPLTIRSSSDCQPALLQGLSLQSVCRGIRKLRWTWLALSYSTCLVWSQAAPKCEAPRISKNTKTDATLFQLSSYQFMCFPWHLSALGYAIYGIGYIYLVTVPIWIIQINVILIQINFINKSRTEPASFGRCLHMGKSGPKDISLPGMGSALGLSLAPCNCWLLMWCQSLGSHSLG